MEPRRAEACRTRRVTVAVAVLLATVVVVSAACSSASSGRTVASLPGRDGHTAATGSFSVAKSDQDFVDFARCMRAHGVAMSDPFHRPGHQGLTLALPPQTSATRGAYSACNHYLAATAQAKEAGAAQEAAPNLGALTGYAQCMRSHDISMLDPTVQGQVNLGDVAGITSDFGRYSPQFRAADSACRHLLPSGVHDDGTGP